MTIVCHHTVTKDPTGPRRPWLAILTLATLVVLGTPTQAQAQESHPSLALMPLSAKQVTPEIVEILDELLIVTVYELGRYDVIAKGDIQAMLGMERMKSLLGCNESSCASEIGGALGVDMMLTGSVGKLGRELVVTLLLVDAQAFKVKARKQRRLPANEELYARAIEQTVLEIVGLRLSDAQWKGYTAYRALAKDTAFEAENIDGWLAGPADRNDDWLAYFAYRGETLKAKTTTLGFDAWYTDIKLGRAEITSTPEGATVTIDGQELGPTPWVAKGLTAGHHEVRVSLDGYFPVKRRVKITDGETTPLTVTLLNQAEHEALQSEHTIKSVLGWTSLVAGVGMLGTAGTLFAIKGSKASIRDGEYQRYLDATTSAEAEATYDAVKAAAKRHNLFLNLAYVLGAGGLAATVFGLIELNTRPEFDATVVPLDGGAAVMIGGAL